MHLLWRNTLNYDELADKLINLEATDEPTKEKPSYPSGWEPGVVWDGKKGMLTTSTLTDIPTDWSEILHERGLDPNAYEIVGDTIRWTSYDGWKRDAPGDEAYSAICYSYKAEIRLKRSNLGFDCEELYKEIRKDKPTLKPKGNAERTLFVNLSDWQIGNGDAGGVKTQILALAKLPDQIVDRIKRLKKSDRSVQRVVLAGLGDLVEGTCGFYPSQQFLTEIDRREQTRVVRRALVEIIRAVAKTELEVTVTAVGGNHGENRQNSKRITGFNDNDDVSVFEQVAEIFAESEYKNIGFRLPADRMAVAIECHGQIVSFTHGHLPRPSSNAAETMWGWWAKQAMGRYYPAVADANILVTGHYHHLNVKQQEGRTVFVCPSLTAVGDWFSNSSGVQTVPGTLTFVVDGSGWNDLEVLS
jgi:predicted phosphodiesterase